jgi:cell division protein FtsB
MEVFQAGVSLMVKAVVLSAQWAGQRRLLCLQQAAASEGELAQLRAELVVLRDENQRLSAENALLKGCLGGRARKQRYTAMQRLQILWHMAYYGIPRKRVKDHFGIGKSTFYR